MKTIEQIDQEILNLNEKLNEVKGTETEVYTRIVGYHRAVDNWNKGKREEYNERLTFKLDEEKISNKTLFSKNEKLPEEFVEVIENEKLLQIEKVSYYRLFS